MMKPRENAKKRLSGIFPAFSACHFASMCKVSWKKYKVQIEEFKKYCFSGENRLFREKESLGKSPMKICKNGHFRHFRPDKNFSQKPVSAMFWALLIRIFKKKQKNLMMKSREIAKKPVFPAFSAGKWIFSKNRASSHFRHCHLHLCAKNQQQLMSHSREEPVTNGRTNGQRVIYRTSKVGPKQA